VRYLHLDELGTPSLVTRADGSAEGAQFFAPYGGRVSALGARLRRTTPVAGVAHGFTGHEHEDGRDLINMGARLFDPVLRRFTTPDPVPGRPGESQSFDSYGYALASPLRFVDPTGMDTIEYVEFEDDYIIVQRGGGGGGGGPPNAELGPQFEIRLDRRGGGEAWGAQGGRPEPRTGMRGAFHRERALAQFLVEHPPDVARMATRARDELIETAIDVAACAIPGNCEGEDILAMDPTDISREADARRLIHGTSLFLSVLTFGISPNARVFTEMQERAARRRAATGLLPLDPARIAHELCAGGVCECFEGGTPVLTEDGPRAIEEIEVGTLVWARDQETGEPGWYPVVRRFERTAELVLAVELRTDETSEALSVTPGHPFFVREMGWTIAAELLPDDEVLTELGGWARVSSVVPAGEDVEVFNLEVEGAHTYVAGDLGVWVHNQCSARLGRNLVRAGHVRPRGTAAHHIVAHGEPLAQRAQQVLQRFGVHIDDAANGVFLPHYPSSTAPGMYHRTLHTHAYYAEVNRRLGRARSAAGVQHELAQIRSELLAGTFPR
jgi:RHS repeat-associated protein